MLLKQLLPAACICSSHQQTRKWYRFYWSAFVSSRGKISLGVYPYIILETKPSTCILCCFLKCPLHPKISITQERSDQPVLPSLWKKAASCQVSLVTATAPLNRHSSSSEGTGFTGSTKAEKSYTFYCRFSVSVLESTAALEADIVPTSLPHETATNSSAPGNSKNHAWVCSADKCSSEDQASHMTRH